MLKANARGWMGTRWQIGADDSPPAITLELASVRARATWTLDGQEYQVFRARDGGRPFVLEAGGQRLAAATRPSLWRRSIQVSAGGGEWTLAQTSSWRGRWELSDRTGRIGSIQPASLWRRSMLIDLPETLPIALRIFVAAIVLIFARDDESGATAATVASTSSFS
jgi:hypothetical protein